MSNGLPDILPYNVKSQQELIRIYWKKGNIAGFFFDGFLSVNHQHTTVITSHPVQSGADISDHAYVEPVSLTIQLIMSDATPKDQIVDKLSENYYRNNAQTRSIGAYKILRELQKQKRVFDVSTKFETYSNMMISSIVVSESSETVNALDATISLKQILIANEKYVKVSTRPQTTGDSSNINQNANEVGNDNLVDAFGLMNDPYSSLSKDTKENIIASFYDHASYDIDTEEKFLQYRQSIIVDPVQEFINGKITFEEFRSNLSLMYPAG